MDGRADDQRSLGALADAAPDAALAIDRAGRIVDLNATAERMLGRPRHQMLGSRLDEHLEQSAEHARACERLLQVLAAGSPRLGERFELAILGANNCSFLAELRLVELAGGASLSGAWIRDISSQTEERLSSERELAAHLALADVLARGRSLVARLPELLADVGTALGCTAGAMWLLEEGRMELRYSWRARPDELAELFASLSEQPGGPGQGLAGLVWESGRPHNLSATARDPRLRLAPDVLARGVHGALALPALSGGAVLGVVALFGSEEIEATPRLMSTLKTLGDWLGAFLARRQGVLRPSHLSPREIQILQLAADGTPRREIAARLSISPGTVKVHFEHIYAKLEVTDRSAAVARGLREGLIE